MTLALELVRLDWEAVDERSGVWQHTEYVIELRVALAGATQAATTAPAWTLRRRYSDFCTCHAQLVALKLEDLPELPPKEPLLRRVFGSFAARLEWQESRRASLARYITALLEKPTLQAEPAVSQLLALGAAVRLGAVPEPPALLRLRPAPLALEAVASDACSSGPTAMEVSVQQIAAASLDEERAEVQVPVSEMVVVIRQLEPVKATDCGTGASGADEGDPLHLGAAGVEVAARIHLRVESAVDEARTLVGLLPGYSYLVEAVSVSVVGVQSAKVALIAQVPGKMLSGDRPGAGGKNSGHAAADDNGFSDSEGTHDRDAVSAAYGAHPTRVGAPLVVEQGLDKLGIEDGAEVAVARASSEGRETISAAALRLRRATYRGSAAAEYAAVAAEKMRRSYERAPYRMLVGDLPRDVEAISEPEAAPRKKAWRHAVVSVEPPPLAPQSLDNGEHTLHRDAELLDHERAQVRSQKQLDEAKAILFWVAEITGRRELEAAADQVRDVEAFRAALLSGEALCELANALVTRGSGGAVDDEALPVPSYHKEPQGKFWQMENVSLFIGACRDFFKVPEWQLCCTNDLSEGRDLQAVVRLLIGLEGRARAMYCVERASLS